MKFILHYKYVLLFALLGFFTSCEKDLCVHGSGPIVNQTLDIEELNGFDLFGSFNVILKNGPIQKISAIGQQNIIDQLSYDVNNGIWKIAFEEGCYNDYDLTIEFEVPNINEFGISGSGSIQIVDEFDSLVNLNIFNSGTGGIFTNDSLIISTFLNIDISGSGSISLKGKVPNQNITISGSGSYTAFNLESTACVVSIPGSGNCEVNASNTLDAFLSGSGSLYYIGSPVINANITGSGTINNSN